jgi:hypothetical protein
LDVRAQAIWQCASPDLSQLSASNVATSRSWIQKMESGQVRLDVFQVRDLCRAYRLDYQALLRELDRN